MEPVEEVELQDLGPREEEVEDYEDAYETPLSWSEDFDHFMADGPRQYWGVDPVNNSYKTVHARSERNYAAKQEILFKLFGVFHRSYGEEQTFFLNRTKLQSVTLKLGTLTSKRHFLIYLCKIHL